VTPPRDPPTARSLADELEARLAAGAPPGAAGVPPGRPTWSPDLLTVWLWIPKTGGSSLREVVERGFGGPLFDAMRRGDDTDSALGIQRLATVRRLWRDEPAERRRQFRLASGHLPVAARGIFGRPTAAFTFLRDPIEHAISFYYWLVRVGLIGREEATEPGRVGLERAVEEGVFVALSNYQTRLLSGLAGLDPPVERFPSKRQLSLPAGALTRATRQLDEMFFVGLTEMFDQSLIVLKSMCGWRLADLVYLRQNINDERPPPERISPEVRHKIAQANAADLALYDHARARFAADAAVHRRDLRVYLPALRLLNEVAGAAGAVDGPVPWPPRRVAAALDAVIGQSASEGAAVHPASPSPPAVAAPEPPRRTARPLLDRVPGASVALGLRLLRRDYGCERPGAIISLKRARDGHCEPFGCLADGGLNRRAAAQLLARSVANSYAWYDQSGHGRDAYAPVSAAEPRCVMPATASAAIRFDPPATLTAPEALDSLPAFSILACLRPDSVADGQSLARWDRPPHSFVAFPDHYGNIVLAAGGSVVAAPLAVDPTDFAVYGAVWREGTLATFRNGVPVGAATSPTIKTLPLDAAPMFIGSYVGKGAYFRGELRQLAVWPRALSPDEVRIASAAMKRG
jgi:concanavalin A-like lectin/glucanase superfamily protein/galactose-3-O-sulfotransferase